MRLKVNVKNPRENRCFQTVIVFSFGSAEKLNKCTVLWKMAARLITVSTSVNNEMWVKLSSWADDCGVGGQPNAPGGDCGWHQMSCLLLVTGSRTGPRTARRRRGVAWFRLSTGGPLDVWPSTPPGAFFLPLALFIGASPVHGDGSGIKRHRLPPLGKSCTSHRRSLDCGRAATSDLASSPARSFQL